ncbi:MAG: NAD(+)/NADH kinase [Gammaproteobacteria bacterium]|nr:MAG: NAD(+)/NADH kinase [Gammaproteobacteria bacterium]
MKPAKFPAVALMGNPDDPRVVESLRTLAAHLAAQRVSVLVADSLGPAAVPDAAARLPGAELPRQAQLMVAVGGDGSMLYAARRAAGTGVPLLGVNLGRLGFLADVGPADMLARLDEVMQGQYESDQRMLLRAEVVEADRVVGEGLALNDIVVSRHDPGRMLEIRTYVDGAYLNTHGGDGFIVATATGSTAYSLSCGGPIIAPALDAIVLAPISPHTLSERPIIVPATVVTEITLAEPHSVRADVSCDGEITASLVPGRRLRVRAAEERVELIHPRGYDYFQILRTKLHWGRDHHSTGGTPA